MTDQTHAPFKGVAGDCGELMDTLTAGRPPDLYLRGYLARWYLTPKRQSRGFVMLHHILGSDFPVFHDHPWPFRTTISNQFAAVPTHHPLGKDVQPRRNSQVSLFHFSWLSIISDAISLRDSLRESKAKGAEEKAYILGEMIGYFQSESSGVFCNLKMSPGWKEVCSRAHQGIALKQSGNEISEAVASGYQLQRYLSIKMSVELQSPVKATIAKKHVQDPMLRLNDDIKMLVTERNLVAAMDVPDTAGKLEIKADFSRKTLDLSIRLDAPKDAKRPTTSINWLAKKQLAKCNTEDVLVTAHWPKRIGATSMPARQLVEEDGASLLPVDVKDLPVSFELKRIVDLEAKFKSVNAFVEIAEAEMIRFYKDVCQNLTRWRAKPPRVKEKPSESKKTQSEEEKLMITLAGGEELLGSKSAGTVDTVTPKLERRFFRWRENFPGIRD